jgi:RNA polymerase sigma-70 factor (ECF subfamily)
VFGFDEAPNTLSIRPARALLRVTSMTDEELMGRVADGDDAAFAALYDRHAARLFGLLTCLLRQRVDAEDALQETFWQVWCQARRYDPARGSVEVWLSMIARSRGLDHRRRPAGLPGSAAASPADPLRALEEDETAREVSQALARLPDEQRQAVSLAYFGGLTHEQVASWQGVPLGTAKTRIRLAMRRLRTIFQGREREAHDA